MCVLTWRGRLAVSVYFLHQSVKLLLCPQDLDMQLKGGHNTSNNSIESGTLGNGIGLDGKREFSHEPFPAQQASKILTLHCTLDSVAMLALTLCIHNCNSFIQQQVLCTQDAALTPPTWLGCGHTAKATLHGLYWHTAEHGM